MYLEKPTSYFHVRFARLLPKKIAVNLLIAVFKENRSSTIATLQSRGAGDRISPCGPNAS